MHLEKFKAPAVSGVSKHNMRLWEGRGFEREHIDNSLISENYNLAPDRGDAVAFVNARISELDLKRAPRKDAVRMVEWVVTQPEGEQDERGFFESVYRHMAEEYGEENVIAAWVHKDEPNARPHMHFDFVPITEDGRLSAKEIVNRNHLRQMHPKMQRLVSADLGHEVAFLLPEEEEGRRELSRLDHSDYIAAKDEIAATKTRLEHLQRQVEEAEPSAVTFAESVRTLYKARSDGEREEVLAGEIDGLRSRISELEGANQRARERVEELDRGLPGLRGRHRELEQRFEGLEQRVTSVVQRLREVPETVSAWALEIARKLGKRTYNPMSLDYVTRQAREVARGMNSARGWEPRRNRGHGR